MIEYVEKTLFMFSWTKKSIQIMKFLFKDLIINALKKGHC